MKLIAILALAIALPAFGTDKHIPKNPLPPKTVYVTERDHDHEWTAALIGAGVTWWIMHRRAKRKAAAVPVPAAAIPVPLPNTCEDRVVRVLEACGK